MKSFSIINLVFLLAALGLGAEPPAVPTPPSTAAPDPMTEALPILQAKYVDFQALHVQPGDHLSDLVARSHGGITLTSADGTAAPPILTATLPGDILYWRLASFAPARDENDLAAQLRQGSVGALGIILDLRSNATPDDFAGAAKILSLFFPADMTQTPRLDASSRLSPFHLPIVILTNPKTTGAAEALAATLQTDGALVVGRATEGHAYAFAEAKLSSGQVLRYAVRPLTAADELPLAGGHPVIPDIALNVDDHNEKGALILIKDNQVLDVIQESAERHRMSEAALVRGDDPEWDNYLASLDKDGKSHFLLSLPPIHDTVLIGALDSLKAIRVSERPLSTPASADPAPGAATSVQ